jgi:hypothetical protein
MKTLMTLIHIQVMPGYLDPISKTLLDLQEWSLAILIPLYSMRKQVISISKVIRE